MAEHDSYDSVFFEPLFAIEDRHFWFRSRNRVIAALFENAVRGLPDTCRVLEVGCGTGNVLRVLSQTCPQATVVGMDLFPDGLMFAKRRGCRMLVQGDVHHAPLRSEFDIVGMFDVLEHLPDDRTVLSDLHSLLKPGGRLLLTVPALPALWSYFDEAAHHCRRYVLKELKEKLVETGYEVEFASYYMMSIFPFVWLQRAFVSATKRSDTASNVTQTLQDLKITRGLNGVLTFVLLQEARFVAHYRKLPIGTSLVAVAARI